MAYKIHAGPVELPNALVIEGAAGSAFLPGNVVVKSGATLDEGAAVSAGQLLIAKENGPGVGGHVDDAFVVGAPVQAYVARQGLYFRVRLETGVACVAGETLLQRGATGQLTLLSDQTAVAVAKETITTTSGDQLVLVEVL